MLCCVNDLLSHSTPLGNILLFNMIPTQVIILILATIFSGQKIGVMERILQSSPHVFNMAISWTTGVGETSL